ncbi:hypothetical protein [Pseudomonas putida]|uniref:hypothetical protein n=1 Tax=Pseudomonas putida TaxID=303 RepID=UPI002DB71B70|nr:hypothetical protein [Pseudomonas putida]WRW03112.1 hypothetical protein VPZ82_26150 [Pseudomonas putida]
MTTGLSRRNILKSVPLVTGGAMLAGALPSIAAAASTGGSAPTGDKTRITYYQVPMQKRWPENDKLVKAKPYAKYFKKDLEAPLAMVNLLDDGPLKPEHVLTPHPGKPQQDARGL